MYFLVNSGRDKKTWISAAYKMFSESESVLWLLVDSSARGMQKHGRKLDNKGRSTNFSCANAYAR